MPRIAVTVTDDFKHMCEMQRRSMAAHLRVISDAYVASDDIRKAVALWWEAALTDAVTPAKVACPACKGTGKSNYGACGTCSGTGKAA